MAEAAALLESRGSLTSSMKDKTLGIRLGVKDLERLEKLQEHYALNASSVIRMLLKQAADAIPEEPMPPPTPIRPLKPEPLEKA